MKDPLRAFAAEQGLGAIERSVRLKGDHGGALFLTPQGLYWVTNADDAGPVSVDLLERHDVRYETGRLSDTLRVGERELGVPTGKGDDALGMIALARLRKAAGRPPIDPQSGRHIESPSEIARAWLAGFLNENEILLAWLDTATERKQGSPLLGNATNELRFFLTTERAGVVLLSGAGDVVVELAEGLLDVEPGFGRARISLGALEWHSTLGNAGLYAELAPVVGMSRSDRVLEVARLNWLARGKGDLVLARRLLEQGTREGDGRARSLAFLVSADLGEPEAARPDPIEALDTLAGAPENVLAELWVGWELGTEAGNALLARLRTASDRAEPWALELHSSVHARSDSLFDDGTARAKADIDLAEHMIAAGEIERARSVLEARLASLPSEALEDLLPASDADLTAGAGGQVLRIRAHELLAQTRRENAEARAELARLQPLVVPRIQALLEVASGDLADRAGAVLSVLEPGGLAASRQRQVAELGKALTDDLLFGLIRHPLAREGGALLGKLQTLLASVPVPDQSVLRDYVERLSPEKENAAASALARAQRLFGLRQLRAYISRGTKGIGLRSYEGAEPFVLIGGRHLEESGFAMTASELHFALGAEVAHLRFGHSRVTSSEVWAGALEKGKQGLDLALGVLPLLRGLKVARQVHQVVQRVPMDAVKRLVTGAQKVQRGVQKRLGPKDGDPSPGQGEVLSALNEDVVAAHRVMQLTADRAGLLLCGDLAASLRAMMLVRADYQAELAVAEREGIDVVLARRTAEGRMVHQDLAVRVAALLSFYLSSDWVRLRDATRAR